MREKFSSELKAAMKAGEKRRVSTIRMIMATLKDKEIEARGQGKTVSDEELSLNLGDGRGQAAAA